MHWSVKPRYGMEILSGTSFESCFHIRHEFPKEKKILCQIEVRQSLRYGKKTPFGCIKKNLVNHKVSKYQPMNWLYLAGFLVAIQLYIVMVGTTILGNWCRGVEIVPPSELMNHSSRTLPDLPRTFKINTTPQKTRWKKLISIGNGTTRLKTSKWNKWNWNSYYTKNKMKRLPIIYKKNSWFNLF